jgi:hypothetical protein
VDGFESPLSIGIPPNADDLRSTDDIRRDIERRRESIAKTVDEAGQRIHQSLSWREQVREHPYGALAMAAGAGAVFAGFFRFRGAAHGSRLTTGLTDDLGRIARSLQQAQARYNSPAQHGLARALGTALTAIATQTLVSVVRQRVTQAPQPGDAAPAAEAPATDEGSYE